MCVFFVGSAVGMQEIAFEKPVAPTVAVGGCRGSRTQTQTASDVGNTAIIGTAKNG